MASKIGIKRSPFSEEWKQHISQSKKGHTYKRGIKVPAIQGAKHHNWKGGITSEKRSIRSSLEFRQWREKIFGRDNYRCIDCGERGYIEAHHIIPMRLNRERLFDTNNGITLCRPCHIKTFGKEIELAWVYFTLASRAA